jgi:hypothetical protein
VDQRHQQLQDALTLAGMADRTAEESIVHLIPKRSIETWVFVLHDRPVNEDIDCSAEPEVDPLIRTAAVRFFTLSRPGAQPPPPGVPSLAAAIPEIRRLE